MYVRAIAIGEKVLGPEHPDLAVWLSNRAGLLSICSSAVDSKVLTSTLSWFPLSLQGKLDEALVMKRKCLAIEERVLSPDQPQMAASLNNLAGLLSAQVGAGRIFQENSGDVL